MRSTLATVGCLTLMMLVPELAFACSDAGPGTVCPDAEVVHEDAAVPDVPPGPDAGAPGLDAGPSNPTPAASSCAASPRASHVPWLAVAALGWLVGRRRR